jgi:hypothetical protein
MRRGMVKALAALACIVLVGALGAASWNGDRGIAFLPHAVSRCDAASDRDEVIQEIEEFHSIWGSYDTGTGYGARATGNP